MWWVWRIHQLLGYFGRNLEEAGHHLRRAIAVYQVSGKKRQTTLRICSNDIAVSKSEVKQDF
jgi:hypothetical protein